MTSDETCIQEPLGDPTVQIRLLSQPRLLAGVRSLVTTLAERVGFGRVGSGHVALAVDEALTNIIRHGYDQRTDEVIDLRVWVLAGEQPGIRIEIEDEADHVDPADFQGRDLEDVRPGGLGVHLMREVMHVCEFEKRAGRGMRVVLEKRLEPPTESVADST